MLVLSASFHFGEKKQEQLHIYSCRKDIEQGFLIFSLLMDSSQLGFGG